MIKRSDDQYIDGLFTWFTGKIEDINDPENLNRVKVRCFGFYDDSIAIDNLPWATVMMPVTSASIQGNGGNHHLEVGSWVVGFFRDGPSAQDHGDGFNCNTNKWYSGYTNRIINR